MRTRKGRTRRKLGTAGNVGTRAPFWIARPRRQGAPRAMKLHSLEIDGFGCLVDESYSLAPGFNIFFGPNEIGKSTLQQAILALLYGFYTKNRRNKEEDALLERFRPWQSAKFGGWLEYALDVGNAYRVIRNFDGDLETHLLDAQTRADLSAEFERGKLGRLDFAEKQFGLSYAVFVNTCFVRQADLHRLDEVAFRTRSCFSKTPLPRMSAANAPAQNLYPLQNGICKNWKMNLLGSRSSARTCSPIRSRFKKTKRAPKRSRTNWRASPIFSRAKNITRCVRASKKLKT
ncbi:MAG: hypothetical protein DCC52_12635 [Chloroflexi bacterium]|nr:MAG: hypothetical protein DCC52_12635 [Chloroflexota bacterium]